MFFSLTQSKVLAFSSARFMSSIPINLPSMRHISSSNLTSLLSHHEREVSVYVSNIKLFSVKEANEWQLLSVNFLNGHNDATGSRPSIAILSSESYLRSGAEVELFITFGSEVIDMSIARYSLVGVYGLFQDLAVSRIDDDGGLNGKGV